MRYYVYVSDAKLDMLYGQIPATIRSRLVAELKLDIKIMSVSIRERESEATRYAKLDIVEKYLERNVGISSISEPNAWFRGRLSLRSGLYRNAPGGLTYFSGLHNGVQLALIGSARHLIGSPGQTAEIGLTYSRLPTLFTVLHRDQAETISPSTGVEQDEIQQAVAETREFADALGGLPEPSEFLARRLLYAPVPETDPSVTHVLLGTPLYVALTDV